MSKTKKELKCVLCRQEIEVLEHECLNVNAELASILYSCTRNLFENPKLRTPKNLAYVEQVRRNVETLKNIHHY